MNIDINNINWKQYHESVNWKPGDRGYVIRHQKDGPCQTYQHGNIVTVCRVAEGGRPYVEPCSMMSGSGPTFDILRLVRPGEIIKAGTVTAPLLFDMDLGYYHRWARDYSFGATDSPRVVLAMPQEETPDQKRIRVLTEAARKAQADLEAALKGAS